MVRRSGSRNSPARRADVPLPDLIAHAQRTDDWEDWYAVAQSLFAARRFDEAISILAKIVGDQPSNDSARLSLATAYSQVSQLDLCRFHLSHIAAEGGTEEFRRTGQEQLKAYLECIGDTPEDRELRFLQLSTLEEATSRPDCPAEDYQQFAVLLRYAAQLEPEGRWQQRGREVLEAGLSRYPASVALLELSVAAYMTEDPEDRLHVALRRLEALAPESPIFSVVAGVTAEDEAGWRRDMNERVDRLFGQIARGEGKERHAAIADLERIICQYPQNTSYRLSYAFALLIVGDKAESGRHAAILDRADVPSHGFHFNLGQIFYGSGDPAMGRKHLDLAYEYAADDQERRDVWEQISAFEKT